MSYYEVTGSWPQVRFSTWDGWCSMGAGEEVGQGSAHHNGHHTGATRIEAMVLRKLARIMGF
jgi:hypothetical protein